MTNGAPSAGRFGHARALLRDPAFRAKVVSFGLVGVVNTAVDYGLFAFAYLYLGFHPVAANVLAWIVANTGSYVLNSFTTFAAESGRILRLRDYLSFVASGLAGFAANTTTVVILSYFMPVLAAKAFAIGVSFAVNFSLSHFVVFPARRAVRPVVPKADAADSGVPASRRAQDSSARSSSE